MKHQIPTSKLQRSSKNQAPIVSVLEYPAITATAWELNETTDGNEVRRHTFDLEERTAQFGEAVIRFCKKIPRAPENNRLIDQLVGCGTSVGANYCEANEGVSKKDFKTQSVAVSKKPKKRNSFSG